MSKNATIIERRNLEGTQGYMLLIQDYDAKESHWVKYDNHGYDMHGFDILGFN